MAVGGRNFIPDICYKDNSGSQCLQTWGAKESTQTHIQDY